MSAHPTHDLAVKSGEYQDHQGQTKGRWLRIGTVFRHDDGGTSIKLDCVPLGMPGWEGWVSVFPRDQGQARQGSRQPAAQTHGHAPDRQPQAPIPPPAPGAYQEFDDEIPFD